MRRLPPMIVLVLLPCVAGWAGGCAADAAASGGDDTAGAGGASTSARDGPTLAFVAGEAVTAADLRAPLLEAAGGVVLGEHVLADQLRRRLAERGLAITAADLAAEEALLTEAIDDDPDQARRLLDELRAGRGLGDQRYTDLLFRNAALRRLTADEVEVPDSAVRERFAYDHGPRYVVRLILVDTLPEASAAIRRASEGESFAELAMQMSTDESAARGGLLEAISPADPSYPVELRRALERLEPGEVSKPLTLEQGLAVVKLERKQPADEVEFADVEAETRRRVRVQAQRLLMERLARTLIQDADVQVLDPSLQESWSRHRRRLTAE